MHNMLVRVQSRRPSAITKATYCSSRANPTHYTHTILTKKHGNQQPDQQTQLLVVVVNLPNSNLIKVIHGFGIGVSGIGRPSQLTASFLHWPEKGMIKLGIQPAWCSQPPLWTRLNLPV
eukprot:15334148-Ditylum_brightwellii.AAC.1